MRGGASDVGSVGDRARRSAGGVRLFAAATTSAARGTRLMAGAAVTGAAAGGVALGLFAKRAIDAATDINESTSKNQVLFGDHAKAVERFASSTAGSLGISRRQALESTGTFGNLFTALKIAPKRSADMSMSLTKLAADLASFNNASPEEALEAIRSGLVGETEPLRRFGVNLSDDALRAEALRKGLVKTTKEALTPQQKALAVNSLLFKQTASAQGDFDRTSRGLANQQRILRARFDDATASLGEAFLPTALDVVSTLNTKVMPRLSAFGRAMGRIWGGDQDRTFAENLRRTGESAGVWLFDPLKREARAFWRENRAAIISGAESAVAGAGARMADAAAAAAPHAAGAFVRAFRGAGIWGQLLTVALVSKKLGVFGTLGRSACGRFGSAFNSCAPGKLEAGARGGKFRNAARAIGRVAGPLAAGVFIAEWIQRLSSEEEGRRAESANPEDTRRTHPVQPGDPTGAEIAANRNPDRDPGRGRSRGPAGIGATPVAPFPGGARGRGASVTPFARKGAAVRAPGGAGLLRVEAPLYLKGRELGRGIATITADDLAGA
jgi:hypothetical protein